MATKELWCKITGGCDHLSIDHKLEVVKDNGFLSSLSEKLLILKDSINDSLSEQVDREKALIVNGSRRMQEADSGTWIYYLIGTTL